MTGVVAAMVVAGSVITGASVTGNGKALCDAMGGKYSPATAMTEACPGGSWAVFFGIKAPKK